MAILRMDKVLASYNGNLESVKFSSDRQNGTLLVLGNLVAGERELHNAENVSSSNVQKEILIHSTAEVMYDERLYKLDDFVLKAGSAGRAYRLAKGDVITLTADGFVTAPTAVGELVVPAIDGSNKLTVDADGKVDIGTATTPNLVTPGLLLEVIENAGDELHITKNAWALKVK